VRYEIVRAISEGGMGIVYEALQHGARNFIKRVAIKVVRPRHAAQKQFLDNFIGEAKLVSDLIHTNIGQTYHLGEFEGTYFIVMELIQGINLHQLKEECLCKKQALPSEMAVFIASRICRGLAYAHGKLNAEGKPFGIVHRDVGFKNVMISWEGDVKLTDFGIAKARGFLVDEEGQVVAGNPEYMSPEQADFRITDRRSDIFSVGVVLAHLLLGQNLFKGNDDNETRDRILGMAIPDFCTLDPRIDEHLNAILQRILARDLETRYGTADELLHDLEYSIYRGGYGPTNETLGKFIRQLFAKDTS
jgi:eukaryotic-like serine/threonine-protein kinase